MDTSISQDVKLLWDYMQLHYQAVDADCLIVLGSRDDRVAEYAADVASHHTYQTVVITGGVAHGHDLLKTSWSEKSEAEHFYEVMKWAGYVGEVLLEDRAQNTGENATLTYALLQAYNVKPPLSILLVTKPYMERRAVATFEAQWPDHSASFAVVSPFRNIDDYMNDDQPYDDIVNIMVGDMQRIMEYPKRGYQSIQTIPNEVRKAWERLIQAGYTKHCVDL